MTRVAAETKTRAPGPLERGGTLEGEKAAGKDAGAAARAAAASSAAATRAANADNAVWSDPRWVNGTWDLSQFKLADGETDWNAVIDAEVVHRKGAFYVTLVPVRPRRRGERRSLRTYFAGDCLRLRTPRCFQSRHTLTPAFQLRF